MANSLDVKFVRSLSGTMAKILLVLFFNPGGMTLEELAENCGVSDAKTLRSACKLLASPAYQALVLQRGEHGRVVYLPSGTLLPAVRDAYYEPDRGKSPIWEGDSRDSDVQIGENPLPALPEYEPERGKSPICEPIMSQNGGNPLPETGSIMIDDDELINLKNESHHHQSEPENSAKPLPSLKTIVDNLDLLGFRSHQDGNLFDPPDFGDFPAETSPDQALAWVIKIYADRKRLQNPFGLLLIRLRTGSRRRFRFERLEILPDAFLEAVGLWRGVCPECGESFSRRERLDAHLDAHAEADVAEDILIEPDYAGLSECGVDAEQVWAAVLDQLRMEMPRASFETWVRDTVPVGWVTGEEKLQIGVRNAYARDWLSSRLVSTVERMLVEGSAEIKAVEFVIFSEVEHG